MTVSSAEEIALMLHTNIVSSADAAMGALGRLERQIIREQNTLGRLEQNLVQAKSKLDQLAEGSADKKAVNAFEKQVAAVGRLREGFRAGKVSADELTAAFNKMKSLQGAAQAKSVDVAAYRKQEQVIAALTDRIGGQKDKIGGLQDKLTAGRSALEQMGRGAQFLGEKFGVTDSQAFKLGGSLAKLGPYGAAIAAGVLLAVAALSLFVGIVAKGISASSQMRREFLDLQAASVSSAMGQSWLFNPTRESTRGAEQLTAAVNRVNATSAAGREKLVGWAADLKGARFQGKQLETTLNAMSIAFSGGGAKGEQMAGDVMNWAKQIRYMGGSVEDLAKRVEQKLGRGAAQAAISFDVQLSRLRSNMTWIFGGADVDPLLRALNSVLKIFNAGSDSASGMRNAITRLTENAIGMMLRLGIVLLKTYLALRTHETAWNTLKLLVKFVAIGVLGLTAAVLVSAGIIIGTVALIVAAIGAPVYALARMIGNFKKHYEELRASGRGIGMSIVLGIINGIADAGVNIWNALKGAVGGAIDKVKNLLESHSPSKVTHRIGFGGIGMGMVGGIQESAPHVERASMRLGRSGIAGIQMGAFGGIGMGMVGGIQESAPHIERAGVRLGGSGTAGIQMGTTAPSRPSSGSGLFGSEDFGRGSGRDKPSFQDCFNNCYFGDNITEEQIRDWVQAALEGDSIDAEVPA